LPVLGLALVSLVPILAHFAVAAKDDRINAYGLCGACVGFLLGWRWAGIGGGVSLLSLGVMVAQSEGGLMGDPFIVAFALQGVLFLISGLLSVRSDGPGRPSTRLMKGAIAGVLALCVIAGAIVLLRGPGPTAVPKEMERYLGVWDSGTGLRIELNQAGEAKVTETTNATVAACNTPVKPGETKVFNATFRGDDFLELAGGVMGEAKVYRIVQHARRDGKQMRMVLNASDPLQRTNSMVMVKKDEKK
jgi:hypothetical protein